jgi:Domain of unknown function (DUF4148)
MKSRFTTMLAASLMMASTCALASSRLTPKDCNSYPFKATKAALTPADVSRELTELESVGYRPGVDNYSPDIAQARDRLHAKYVRDCMPKQVKLNGPSTSG